MSKARQLADLGNQIDDGAITGSNMVVNGGMTVAQRGTSVTGLTGTAFLLDRFELTNSNHGTWTLSQDTDAPAGFSKSMKILCTTIDSSVGSADYSFFLYKLEGNEVQQLASGTASAKSLTLSFWVKSNVTGTFSATFRNEDNNRQCGGAYTVNSSGTWEYKTVTIPPDTVAGYTDDNTLALQVEWWLGAGSAFTGGTLPTSWETSSNADRAGANTVDVGTVTNGYFQITGVCLNVGDSAIDFPHESYGDTLAKCQRYFQAFNADSGSNTILSNGIAETTSQVRGAVPLLVQMRAVPSVSVSDITHFRFYTTGQHNFTGGAINGLSKKAMGIFAATSASMTAGHAGQVLWNSASGHVHADAEL